MTKTNKLITEVIKRLKTRGVFRSAEEVEKYFEKSLYKVRDQALKECNEIKLENLQGNPDKIIEWAESEIKEYQKLIKLVKEKHIKN